VLRFKNTTGIRKRIGFSIQRIACNALEHKSTAVVQVGICAAYQIEAEIRDVGAVEKNIDYFNPTAIEVTVCIQHWHKTKAA
jgi:hypothetical protein